MKQYSFLLEGKEVEHILGTITDEREKAFLTAVRKIAKDFDIIKNIYRDDNCIYVNLKDNYDEDQKNELGNALDVLVKGFHFGRSDFFEKDSQHSLAFFAMVSSPTDRHGNDVYQKVTESVTYNNHKFNVGDKIKVRKDIRCIQHGKNGIVLNVKKHPEYDYDLVTCRIEDGSVISMNDGAFVKLDNSINVGDKVKINPYVKLRCAGKTGEVINVKDNKATVKFSFNVIGNYNCMIFDCNELEKVTQ